MNVRARLKDLVALPSTEHDDPGPILAYVSAAGRDLGARVTPVPNGARPAVLLSWGKPRLLFSGHLDTVPMAGPWKSRSGAITGGRMYGRGTTDMKAGCAAMLVAAERGRSVGDFGILYTTDEETHMHGAEAAVARGLLAATTFVVVGEPTSLRPNLGQKGILQVTITTRGKSGHASMPWSGTNAIARMGRLLAALRPFDGATRRRAATLTASPDVIEGGVAMNVIAERCTLSLDVRYSPRLDEAKTRARLEGALKKSEVPYTLEVVHRLPPVASRPTAEIRRLKALTRQPFGFCDFGTEAACFAPLGASFLVLGPGEPHHCHITDESVELAQVERAVTLYEAALTTRS
ncbi:MAG: M20/M25/M40 family metallo-hydrolase [Candidatus Eisenbacteria bacterium]